ncbi:DUF2201 family putative metallopeptidase [Armatimonas rosea]|uniref:Putative metal-dependent peptidase n=1 Tax=Armatimonas rosea TaxID=685828 RepID=A0A7W9SVL7_ARMRO|nr:putative metal-dependent peptidase [Armatimonas rosea]
MAKRESEKQAQTRLQQSRWNLGYAKTDLERSPLVGVAKLLKIEESESVEVAGLDHSAATIYVNVHHAVNGRHALSRDEWLWVLAHMALHFALNHAPKCSSPPSDGGWGAGSRDPMLWSVACDVTVDRLLRAMELGRTYRGNGWLPGDSESEEALYDELLLRREQGIKAEYTTLAGKSRPDLLGLTKALTYRHDAEARLADGIRKAVLEAVESTAEHLTDAEDSLSKFPALAAARRWVFQNLPLLGAVAQELKIIARADLCDRMDISVAAVNGFLGELYWNPAVPLSHDEMVFVYAHELLHVALLHHTRAQGRDPHLWNLACDFCINAWLIEMGVGKMPLIGALYDPRLKDMGAEEVYDLLLTWSPKERKKLRGLRGALGDVLLDTGGRRLYRGDATTLDDIYKRALQAGMACQTGRGLIPAGLMEEIQSLFTPPVPWDVELAHWLDRHVPRLDDYRRSFARASRRQASTPEIPRAARYLPQEVLAACTFGVILDTSGSMDRQLLGRSLGAIASFAEARGVPAVRLVLCDAAPYDKGFVEPSELRGLIAIQGRGGTVLQPGINYLVSRPDFPTTAPVMILTDGWCEEQLQCPREHCFVVPRGRESDFPLRNTTGPIFRVLKEDPWSD